MMPSEQMLTEMGKFNEKLAKASVLLAGEGLHPSSKATRIKFSGDKRILIDGPFAEIKDLIAGFWIWQVKSKDEAIEWLKRAPFDDTEVEIRQVFEAEDFGAELTPQLGSKRSASANKLLKNLIALPLPTFVNILNCTTSLLDRLALAPEN
jgi:hypothetical protein